MSMMTCRIAFPCRLLALLALALLALALPLHARTYDSEWRAVGDEAHLRQVAGSHGHPERAKGQFRQAVVRKAENGWIFFCGQMRLSDGEDWTYFYARARDHAQELVPVEPEDALVARRLLEYCGTSGVPGLVAFGEGLQAAHSAEMEALERKRLMFPALQMVLFSYQEAKGIKAALEEHHESLGAWPEADTYSDGEIYYHDEQGRITIRLPYLPPEDDEYDEYLRLIAEKSLTLKPVAQFGQIYWICYSEDLPEEMLPETCGERYLVAEGFYASGATRTALTEDYVALGTWPQADQYAYPGSRFDFSHDDQGIITVTYGEPERLSGKTLTLSPEPNESGSLSWTCSTRDLPAEWLPPGCEALAPAAPEPVRPEPVEQSSPQEADAGPSAPPEPVDADNTAPPEGMVSRTPSGAAVRKEINLTLVNQSAWTLYEMYMTASDYDYWGEDLLDSSGEVVLINGEAITIQLPEGGLWDLKIVDEDGDECIVQEIGIYEDEYVEVTSEMLLSCYQ